MNHSHLSQQDIRYKQVHLFGDLHEHVGGLVTICKPATYILTLVSNVKNTPSRVTSIDCKETC